MRLKVHHDSELIDRDLLKHWLGQWGSTWDSVDDGTILLVVEGLYEPAEVLAYINSLGVDDFFGIMYPHPDAVQPPDVIVPAKAKRGKTSGK